MHDGRLAYLEPITIGTRIRDLVEGHDGRIILWTDDQTLISLGPQQGSIGEGLFEERCGGCHQSMPLSGNRMGPNLSSVMGRRVASLDYPDYSACLRGLGGVWTQARLDLFLTAPRAMCPGTVMDFEGVTNEKERMSIIRYLRAR
jgi:cytochrome c2